MVAYIIDGHPSRCQLVCSESACLCIKLIRWSHQVIIVHGVELITQAAVLRPYKMSSILCAKSKRKAREWTIVGITVFGCIPLQALPAHLSARSAWLEHTRPPWVCTFGQTVADPCINDQESHCDRCCKLWHMHLVSGRSILQRLWCASISCYL